MASRSVTVSKDEFLQSMKQLHQQIPSLYTDVVLFSFSFFSETSAIEARMSAEHKKEK